MLLDFSSYLAKKKKVKMSHKMSVLFTSKNGAATIVS